MFETKKTLIVVYKDELLMNQLKKLIESHDDSDDKVVGTRDDSINVVSWTEKVWLGNKKAGNITGKILFLGKIKGTDKLIPVLDIKIDEYGVKFGWAGNQAVLYVDPKELTDRKIYDSFLKELVQLPVPDFLKPTSEISKEEASVEPDANNAEPGIDMEAIDVPVVKKKPKHKPSGVLKAVKGALEKGVETVSNFGDQVSIKAEEMFRNKQLMARQMFFYGVVHLYEDGLETFMNQ